MKTKKPIDRPAEAPAPIEPEIDKWKIIILESLALAPATRANILERHKGEIKFRRLDSAKLDEALCGLESEKRIRRASDGRYIAITPADAEISATIAGLKSLIEARASRGDQLLANASSTMEGLAAYAITGDNTARILAKIGTLRSELKDLERALDEIDAYRGQIGILRGLRSSLGIPDAE